MDIGDVTINNAIGSDAVPVRDGGNSITVDSEPGFPIESRQVAGDVYEVRLDRMADLLGAIGKPVPVTVTAPTPVINIPTSPVQTQRLDALLDSVDVSGSTVRIEGVVDVRPVPALRSTRSAFIVSNTNAVRLAGVNTARSGLSGVNNGAGSLYLGHDSSVTTSGPTAGLRTAPLGTFKDKGISEVWGIYDATATTENVVVDESS